MKKKKKKKEEDGSEYDSEGDWSGEGPDEYRDSEGG